MTKTSHNRGLTLVDTVIALGIIGICLSSVFALLPSILGLGRDSVESSKAIAAVNYISGSVFSEPFAEVKIAGTTFSLASDGEYNWYYCSGDDDEGAIINSSEIPGRSCQRVSLQVKPRANGPGGSDLYFRVMARDGKHIAAEYVAFRAAF